VAPGSAGVAPRVRLASALAHRRVALVLVLGLVLRAVLLPITAGPDFRIWDLTAAAALHGQDIYSRPPAPIDRYGPYAYFPLYLYLLLPLKWLALHTGLPYIVLGKLPVVAGDAGVALGLATALRRAGRDEDREDGPAVERADGDKLWYRNGQLHRDDGPALEGGDGRKEWYRDGKPLSWSYRLV